MSVELLYAMRARLRTEFEYVAARHTAKDQGKSLTAGEGQLTPEGTALVMVGLLGNVPVGCPALWKFDEERGLRLEFTYRKGYTGQIDMLYLLDGQVRVRRTIPAGWAAVTVRRLVERFVKDFCSIKKEAL
jgi:hypothetical protein